MSEAMRAPGDEMKMCGLRLAAALWVGCLVVAGVQGAGGEAVLVIEPEAVDAGGTFTARVEGAPPGAQVRWEAGRNAQLHRIDSFKRQAVFKTARAGAADVAAIVGGKTLTGRVEVRAAGGGIAFSSNLPTAPVAGVAAGWASGLKPPGTYDAFAEQVIQRFLKTGQASERDMLYLMARPQEFNKLIEVWRGRGAEGAQLVEKVLSIRKVLVRRALSAIRRSGEAAQTFAVMALGSWATELNAGDMDALVHGGPGAAQEFNAALDQEIVRIIEQEGDDVFKAAVREGVTITVERLEIFVSTLGDFGYRQFGRALTEAIAMGDAAGAEHLRRAGGEIIRRNLAAQQRAALNPEVYAGQSGFDFAQDYARRNFTCWVTQPGSLPVREDMTAQQLVDRMMRELGLMADPGTPGIFNFARVATEYAEWMSRASRGAREQAKGIRRTLAALNPRDAAAILADGGNSRIARIASVLANCKRDEVQHIRELLEMLSVTEAEFSAAGEKLLWEAVKRSNAEALGQIETNIAQAKAARAAGRAVEAEYRRIMDYLKSQEQLAGYAKLNGEQLMRLSKELPADMAMRDECEALLEFMAVGARREADDAAELAIRLIRLAQKNGRLGAKAAEEAAELAKSLKPLPEEVQGIVASLRRDLAELAGIQAIAPEGTTVGQCLELMRQYRKNAPSLLAGPEVDELVAWLNRAGEMELLRMGFRESEIAVLRQVARARANGLNPAGLGNAAKKGSPKHWGATVVYVGIGGGIAVYQMIQAAGDPNSAEGAFEEALYGSFPTFGLLVEGLPGALGEADAGSGWSNWSLEQVQGKKLAGDVALAMLEGVGLAFPEVGAVILVAYVAGSVGLSVAENKEEREFVQALYDAMDENGDLNTSGGKRSFLTLPPPRIEREPGVNRVRVVHSAAFDAMYGPDGNVKLVVKDGAKAYDGVLREAVRAYAARRFWAGSKKLESWETAVGRYFPSLDLNLVESWSFGEVSEQGATVSGKPFRVGAHMVRRYVHERDLLTEAAIQQLFSRVASMKQLISHGDDWKKQLEEIEKGLSMEGKIVPKAREEVESFAKWVKDGTFTSDTRLEQVAGIWKRYLKTYGEALKFLNGRVAAVYAEAGLDKPAGDEFFGLSGAEPEDAPKIQKVYENFQGAFLDAAKDFKAAKGAAPDTKNPFDADAWGRLLSVSLRLLVPVTEAREAKLKAERDEILTEIREHYKAGVVQLGIKGPEPAQPKAGDTVRVSAEFTRSGGDGTPIEVVWFGGDGKSELRRGGVFEIPKAKEGDVKLVVAAVTRPAAPAPPVRVAEKAVAFKVGPAIPGKDAPETKPDDKPGTEKGDGKDAPASGMTSAEDDGKPVRLRLPKEVLAGEIFEAEAIVPEALKARIIRVCWENAGRNRYTPDGKHDDQYLYSMEMVGMSSVIQGSEGLKVRIQAGFPAKPSKLLVKADVNLKTATPIWETVSAALAIDVKPLAFAANVPANWKAETFDSRIGYTPYRDALFGVVLTRKEFGPEPGKAEGQLTIAMKGTFPRDDADLAKIAADLAFQREPGTPITIGDFKGFQQDGPNFLGRPRSDALFVRDYYEGRRGRHQTQTTGGRMVGVAVQKNYYRIEVNGSVRCWVRDPDNEALIDTVVAEATAGLAEIRAIIGSLRLTPEGGFTSVAPTAVAAPPQAPPLAVKVSASTTEPKFGQTVDVRAEVTGGKAPYTYTWAGDHGGQGEKVAFVSLKAGDHKLSVEVRDAEGKTASGEVTIKVAAVKATVLGLPERVVYGQQVGIRGSAEGMVPEGPAAVAGQITDLDGDPIGASKGVKFIWHADKEGIAFEPPEGESTTVTFGRMGPAKIWAQVIEMRDNSTLGETPQAATEVIAPKFRIKFDPAKGKVGQEVRARVTTEPEKLFAPIFYRWSMPESSNRMEYDEAASDIGFKTKEPKPFLIVAAAEAPHYRDRITNVSATFTPEPYTIKVTVEEAETTKPKVWDPVKGGVVTLPRGTYAGDEQIRLRAEIQDSPKPDDVRWKWTVNEGTSIGNDISQTPTVSRHETGSIAATVEARDKEGVLLGTGSINLAVTVAPSIANPIVVAVKAEKSVVNSGQATKVRAEVRGGTPPYTYQWGGGASGSGETAEFRGGRPGDAAASVQVKDAKGKSGGGSVPIKVEPVEIQVQFVVRQKNLFAGASVDIVATASGGTEPYKFTWAAPVQGEGGEAKFVPEAAGDVEVSVDVEDKFGNKGRGKLPLAIAALEVTIEGLRESEVPGASRELKLKTPLEVPVQAVFSSDPALAFEPATAPDGKSRVRFRKPGGHRVRAEAQVKRDGGWITVGRSIDHVVDVIAPKLELGFEPARAFVRQEVKATLVEDPALEKGTFAVEWKGLPAGGAGKQAEASFRPPGTNAVELVAVVKSVPGDETIGEAKAVFRPQPLEVKLEALQGGRRGPGVPMGLRASIAGGPSDVVFVWSAKGGTIVGEAKGPVIQVGVAGSEACEVEAVAQDRGGAVLGRGSINLGGGAAPMEVEAEAEAAAQRLVNEGFALEKEGRLAEAVRKFEAAAQLWKDQRLEEHIRELKARVPAEEPAGSGAAVPGGVR